MCKNAPDHGRVFCRRFNGQSTSTPNGTMLSLAKTLLSHCVASEADQARQGVGSAVQLRRTVPRAIMAILKEAWQSPLSGCQVVVRCNCAVHEERQGSVLPWLVEHGFFGRGIEDRPATSLAVRWGSVRSSGAHCWKIGLNYVDVSLTTVHSRA